MKYILTLTLLLTSSVAFAIDPVNHPDTADEGFINLDDAAAPSPASPAVEGQDWAPISEQIPSAEEIKTDEQVAPLVVQDQVAAAEEEIIDENSQIFDGVNYDSLNIKFKSLFYTPEQTDLIYSNLSNFKASGGAMSELKADAAATGDNETPAVPEVTKQTFYLSSILYPMIKNGRFG